MEQSWNTKKKMGGIQLLADMEFNSEFIKAYGRNS
jgi:hypothetical protein